MTLLGIPFEVIPSRYEEPPPPNTPVTLSDFVLTLARAKAGEVASRLPNGLVIGADTLVTLDTSAQGIPLGKPRDRQDAHRMLTLLSGCAHTVWTGIAIVAADGSEIPKVVAASATRTGVRFRSLSRKMIDDYIATGEPMDKAGAYGAQGYAAPFIEGFEGDFYNVVGLPLCELGRCLEACGVDWWHHREQMPPLIG